MTAIGQRFAQRVALVTGASRGIGLAVAERIVAEGGLVCITGRKDESLRAAVTHLGGASVAMAVAGSSDDADHQDRVLDAVRERFGRLDVLVNNTGVNPAFGPLLSIEERAMRKIVDVNVIATLAWVRKAVGTDLGHRGGTIVNIASVAGLRPARDIGFYGASKAAIVHLTQQLAFELAPEVRVNAVAPAVVKTEFAGPLFDGKEQEVVRAYPMGCLGAPEDIAAAVAFLAAEESSWITGQVLTLDGGLTLNGGV